MGLGYPGGPKIDKAAKEGNPLAINFPKAKVNDNKYDFSFSGIKSAVLNYQNQAKMKNEEINVPDLVASFQKSVVDVLTEHTIAAAKEYNFKTVAMAGGVAANSCLRESLQRECDAEGIRFCYPSPVYCTDNAAMIGAAAYFDYMKGIRHSWDLNACPNLALEG